MRDVRDGDVLDVEVVALDQEQEQVERPFEHLQVDLLAHLSLMARRTASIVDRAAVEARRAPSASSASIFSGAAA